MAEKTLLYVSTTTYHHPNTISWLPVQAINEHDDCYRIIEESSDSEPEYWQFTKDEIVKCRENKFAENEFGLIAVEKCDHYCKYSDV